MSSKFKFYLNDEEREEYRDRVGLAEPMTAESEYYFAVMHSDGPHPPKYLSRAEIRKSMRDLKKRKEKHEPKKAKALGAQNEDGYPMKLCTYEPKENRFVYRPPGYGDDNQNKLPHCCSCHLKPCVAEEYRDETDELFFHLQIEEEKPDLVAQEKSLVFLHKKYCKAIKRRYLKKLKPPQCIADSVASFSAYFNVGESNAWGTGTGSDEPPSDDDSKAFLRHPFHYGDTDESVVAGSQPSDSSEVGTETCDSEYDSDLDDTPTSALLRNREQGDDVSATDMLKLYKAKMAQQKVVTRKYKRKADAASEIYHQSTGVPAKQKAAQKVCKSTVNAPERRKSVLDDLSLPETDEEDFEATTVGAVAKVQAGNKRGVKRKSIAEILATAESDEEFEF